MNPTHHQANKQVPSNGFQQLARTPGDSMLASRDARLQSLKSLASKLSHDVNNFLAPVLGYVALINEESSADLTIQQYAQAIESSTRKTEENIESILNAVRPQRRFRPKLVDLSETLRNELSKWQSGLPNSTKVRVEHRIGEVVTVADEEQWKKTFQHLLVNAHFALATGGTLKIVFEAVEVTPRRARELGIAEDLGSGYFQLVIDDSGFGMPETILEQSLDPLFSTRSKGQGMGLGLTLAHSVSRLHGGQLLITSAHDQGTQVEIVAPFLSEAFLDQFNSEVTTSTDSEDSNSSDVGVSLKGPLCEAGKILLVDDDPMVLEVIKACLVHEKFDIITARNGEEGIRLFRRNAERIALVVSDITMPKMTGIDLVREIREQNVKVPILLISGDAEAAREESLLNLPEPRPTLLHKPFSLKELMEAMAKKYNETHSE